MEQIDYKFIDQVLADHACDASQIIAIMQDVQAKYRYLPKDALRYIADKVGISESKIYGVATFYENFSLDVKGKYVLKVCRGTACHVRKSGNVLQALYDATGLSESKPTTDDGLFTIEIVSCLGACGHVLGLQRAELLQGFDSLTHYAPSFARSSSIRSAAFSGVMDGWTVSLTITTGLRPHAPRH